MASQVHTLIAGGAIPSFATTADQNPQNPHNGATTKKKLRILRIMGTKSNGEGATTREPLLPATGDTDRVGVAY